MQLNPHSLTMCSAKLVDSRCDVVKVKNACEMPAKPASNYASAQTDRQANRPNLRHPAPYHVKRSDPCSKEYQSRTTTTEAPQLTIQHCPAACTQSLAYRRSYILRVYGRSSSSNCNDRPRHSGHEQTPQQSHTTFRAPRTASAGSILQERASEMRRRN
jgi:hypothetical protein